MSVSPTFSQTLKISKKSEKSSGGKPTDSIENQSIDPVTTEKSLVPSKKNNSINLSDSIATKKSNGGIDSVVVYTANDSIIFYARKKKLRLKENARVKFKTQDLSADIIEIDFEKKVMNASTAQNSDQKEKGIPKFIDGNQNFVGSSISYNFQNMMGRITQGETQMDGGFFYGTSVKRVQENTLFVENGCYSTCDEPHPHFYFTSPKMKVITGDRVFLDPVILYVSDIPVFVLPIGVYFPNKASERQSGLLLNPNVAFSRNRGVTFTGIGYYFGFSDYIDSRITFDLFSKGGVLGRVNTSYLLRDILNGSVNISYGSVRQAPQSPYETQWSLDVKHTQTFTPQTQASVDVNFLSNGFFQSTSARLSERISQNVYSRANINHTFDNSSTLSLNYTRNQNIIENTYTQSPSIGYQIPAYSVLKPLFPNSSEFADVILSGGAVGTYEDAYRVRTLDSSKRVNPSDSLDFYHDEVSSIDLNPSLTISPKVGYFTVQPRIDFRSKLYFRRLKDYSTSNPDTLNGSQQINQSFENGLFLESAFSVGLNVSTKIFGTARPNLWGLKAIRHTILPNVGISWTPNQGTNNAYYATYFDSLQKKSMQISRFYRDRGGISARSKDLRLTYSFDNSIDLKLNDNDTASMDFALFRFNLSSSYNLAADSLNFGNISFNVRTPALDFIGLNIGGTVFMYDQVGNKNFSAENINKIAPWLQNISVASSFNFGSEGTGSSPQTQDSTKNDSTYNEFGSRFNRRTNFKEVESDIFGDSSPGYSPFSPKWNMSVQLSYILNRPSIFTSSSTFNVSGSFDFDLTKTWRITSGYSFDVIENKLNAPNITVSKQIHCWQLDFTWYPSGFNSGFYLNFHALAPQLRDLKIEKRSSPIFR